MTNKPPSSMQPSSNLPSKMPSNLYLSTKVSVKMPIKRQLSGLLTGLCATATPVVSNTAAKVTANAAANVKLAVALSFALASSGVGHAAGLTDLFPANNASAQADFLSVDEAFTVVPVQKGNTLTLSLEITPAHYLYKDKFALKLPPGVSASPFTFSQTAHTIDDPNFGQVPIFDQPLVTASTTLTNHSNKAIVDAAVLTWQGCAKAGLCYPPQRQTLALSVAPAATPSKTGTAKSVPSKTVAAVANEPALANTAVSAKASQHQQGQQPALPAASIKATVQPTPKTQATAAPAQHGTQTKKDIEVDNASAIAATATASISADGQHKQSGQNTQNTQVETALAANTVANANTINPSGDANDTSASDNNNVAATASSSVETGSSGIAASEAGAQTPITTPPVFSNEATLAAVGNQDPFGLAQHPLLALLLLFIAGLGLSFTACVLPMLPIVSNIIARQHNPTARKGLLLSGSYALGVAVAYGGLGAAIAVFGEALGIVGWLQNPMILLGFAAVFAILALYMLDLFSLSLPSKLKQKMHRLSQAGDRYLGSSLGSFAVGLLSALVVSPCVSAPLVGALAAVSTIGSPLLGFGALFMLGFGVSAPLMLVGVSQGSLMPKAGVWMHWVKQGFALMLFAVALLLVERVFMSALMLLGWATWFAVVAGWAWQWQGRGQPFVRPLAVLLGGWSACLLLGAAGGSRDAWQPLAVFNPSMASIHTTAITASNLNSAAYPNLPDKRVTNLQSLAPIIAQNPKVLVDVTADWCVECRIMEKTLFTNRPSQLQGWQVVKLDITESNADTQQVLKQLRLFGPPVLMYFVDGDLKAQQAGNVPRDTFEKTLANLE